MAVFEGSRYSNASVLRVRTASGKTLPALYGMIAGSSHTLRYRLYTVRAGERYDTIAASIWGDPELWWRVADLNPEHLFPDLPEGTTIRIPAT
jgi:hypothetical protein